MTNAKLKERFKNVIEFHYGREMWRTYPELSYEVSIDSFIKDLVRITSYHKRGKMFPLYKYDEEECFEPTINGQHIGAKIRKLREKNGWSITRLAKKIDVDALYLHSIETGEPLLELWVLERLLKVFKVKSSVVLPF